MLEKAGVTSQVDSHRASIPAAAKSCCCQEKNVNSQSLSPRPVKGVGLRQPSCTGADARGVWFEGEALTRAQGLLWNAHPTGMSSHSLFEEVNPARSQHL